jgi:hypothetical protein
MTVQNAFYVAAAAVVVAWPNIVKAVNAVRAWPMFQKGSTADKLREKVAYEIALHALAVCRARIVATEHLDEKAKAAIDTLTLALVAGSDK